MHELTCDEVLDAAPQFALDILEPGRRSEVAAHLIRCPGCRTEVTDMQESAAALLDLDGADWSRPVQFERPWPPSGPGPARPGRRRIRVVVTLAAAALLMVGSAFGPEIQAASTGHPTPLAHAELLDGSRPVGYVDLYSGHQPTMEMQVIGLSASGQVLAETVNVDGTVTRLGSFGVSAGRGYWALGTPLDMSQVSSVMVVDGQGRVLASASLAPALS